MKIGDIGHLSVLLSFISAVIASGAYYMAAISSPLQQFNENKDYLSWKNFARIFFYVHGISVFSIVISLYMIIYNHHYEYHYAWSHASNSLPVYYVISSFWEGQEGSFLLWIFWHVLLGLILIRVNRKWEVSLMTVFMLVQAFLVSMIIGVQIPWLDIKIGSSPFILLKEYMSDMPVYAKNPDFIPADGTGLNPLLQNYWMVIHPPTLFLGFALTIIPFSYVVAALWQKQFKEWIRPALPWALVGVMILGTGILMGGYWAYETLNFGGYWNWDPVENAVYVPWLVLVASVHSMISYKNSETALRTSFILTIVMYLLILYSTFLTRSGILGESSVHSFTDLGLSSQLLIYLLTFVLIALVLLILNWKKIPSTEKETTVFSREFWVFIGVAVLCLAAFQVIYFTSFPVYNAIFKSFGFDSKLAPPAEQAQFYSDWQIWFAIGIALLSGIGQFFWWKKMDKEKLWNAMYAPLILAMLITTLIVLMGIIGWTDFQINKVAYILLILTSLFSLFSNITIFVQVVKNNYKLSGGAVAHIGVALMLFGVLFSSGYSKVVSKNTSGLTYSNQLTTEDNAQNLLLFRNDPETMNEFQLIYKGPRVESDDVDGYVDKDQLILLDEPNKAVVRKDVKRDGDLIIKKGDTISFNEENTYYEVEYVKNEKDTFRLFPRLQVNREMGNVVSPDIKRFAARDLYSHLSMVPVDEKEREWSATEEYKVKAGDTIFLNDYVTILDKLERVEFLPGIKLTPEDIAVRATIRILGKSKEYTMQPVYVLKISEGNLLGIVPEVNEDLGLRVALMDINPQDETFTIGVNTSQKDFIILKVVEKPWINFLWIGTIVLIIGLCIASYRRYDEFVKMRNKGQEFASNN